MRIDIWSDLVCPWCYVGKRRFERALERFPHSDGIEIVHRAFQLDPTFDRGRTEKKHDVLKRKYRMSDAQAIAVEARMQQVAAAEGLTFHGTGGVIGNTLDGHRLVRFAKSVGLQDAVLERFYRAHFIEQRSIFDPESLVALAADAGLNPAAARDVAMSDAYADAVAADLGEARLLQITGVPFFRIDRFGVSGAQTAEVFGDALERAWAHRAGGTPVLSPL